MPDEQETIAPELETPIEGEVEGNEPELELAEDVADDTDESEGEDEDDGLEDVDIDGRNFRLPKGVQARLMKDADYTQKTQALAAERKELADRREALNQRFQAAEQEVALTGMLKQAESALQQYQSLTEADWNQWFQNDSEAANANWRRYEMLQRASSQGKQELEQLQKARTDAAEQETASRLRETLEYAQKNIKGWSLARDAKITEFAVKEIGIPVQMLHKFLRPEYYKVLHFAELGFQASQKPVAPPKPAQPPAKPLETIKAKAAPPVRKTLREMSVEDHAKHIRQENKARYG